MSSFTYTVDTTPMAASLDAVNGNVKAVGVAVTGMQAAVIASERAAADKICKSIDGGFYMLLKSRLSQRIAQFASIMNSRTGSMMETASAIDRTHQQMFEDFTRIKSRYLKLFDRLDRNLDQRVRELDRPAMRIAQHRTDFLSAQRCRAIPAVVCYLSDTATASLRLSCARVKARSLGSIAELGSGARRILGYDEATREVFEDKGSPACDSAYEYMPVVYAITESQVTTGSYSLLITPPATLDESTQARIAAEIRREQDRLEGASDQDLSAVRASFADKVAASSLDLRCKRVMTELFEASFPEDGMRRESPSAESIDDGQAADEL